MMPTREQLIEGLRKADAAGNFADARRFAELIKQQPKQQEIDISSIPEFQTVDGLNAMFGSQFGDENTGVGQIIRDAAAGLFTLDPKARVDGFKKRFPELEIQPIGEDNAIIKNPRTGAVSVLNQEGLSNQDIAPLVGSMIAFTPAAKAVQVPATVLGKMGVGAVASGATDAILQGGEMLQGSEQGFSSGRSLTTSALGGVLPGVPAIARSLAEKSGINKLMKGATPTIENIKARASDIYKEIGDLGVTLPGNFTTILNNKLAKRLQKEGAPELFPTKIKQLFGLLNNRQGKRLSLSEMDSIRKSVGDLARSADPAERRLGAIVTEQIDDAFERAGSNIVMKDGTVASKYREARKLWRTSKKAEILEDLLYKANNQASGRENGIRRRIGQILDNKKLKRNFNPDEIAAMERAVQGTKVGNIFRMLGKFGLTEGQASSALLGYGGIAGGAAIGGVPGAVAVPLAGSISKSLAQKITRNNASMAERLIKVGPDALEIARTYFRATPQAQRSSEELAELFMLRGARLDDLKKMSVTTTPHFRELAENAGLIASGANVSAQ